MYSDNQLCKKEVFHDVEQIRQSESCAINYAETNNAFNDCEKLSLTPVNNQIFPEIVRTDTIVRFL